MGECSSPFPMQLAWDAEGRMELRSKVPLLHNKQIPLNTILCTFTEGAVESAKAGGFAYAFENVRKDWERAWRQ